MIFDHLRNASLYTPMSPRLAAALEFLQKTDLAALPLGRVELDGTALYAIKQTYETRLLAAGKWEAHRRYADVQYILSGEEQIGYAPLETLRVSEPYNEEKDYLLLEGPGSFVTVRPGMFSVLYPEDAHMPGIALDERPSPVEKVVVKLLLE